MSKDILIAAIEGARVGLERTAAATPDDKLHWKPLDNGRTVLDLLGDAAQTPAMVTTILNGTFRPSPDLFKKAAQERAGWTRDEAMQHLKNNTQQLIEAIQATPDEKLNEPLHLPMGGGMTMPLGAWVLMANRSFVSRMAQINYIQTLYGDFDSH